MSEDGGTMTDESATVESATGESAEPAAPAAAKEARAIPMGRIALILAALIAVAAIALAIYRSQTGEDAAAPAVAEAEQAPPVEQVIADLEKKLQEEPDNAENWRMLGWSYFETGRYAESATAMRRAVSLDPDNPEYHSMLGEALVLAVDDPKITPDARAAFKRALELDPKDARARYFIAATKDIDGDHAGAIDSWFALLADTPADAPYAQDIRDVIRNVGKERGIEVEKRLADSRFAPANGGFRTDGGDVAAAAIPGPSREQMQAAQQLPQGQQDAMIQNMVDGLAARLKKDPNDADGWIMLMRSRMQLGETAKAQQALADASSTFRNNAAQLRRIREAATALGVPGA
ncbi:MAG: tetratricopeptide repeat protein [Blastomonas sp.]